MKKTLLTRRNALFSSTNFSWGALSLVLVVFLLLLRILFPNFFWQIVTPIFRTADTLTKTSRTFVSSFENTFKLSIRNKELISENLALLNENRTLIQKLNSISKLSNEAKEIVAGVLMRPPVSPYDTLVISEGSNGGVKLGHEVFGEGNVPLGVVSEVFTNFSRITLFSSPGMTVGGWVGNENVPITIKGSGAGVMDASVSRTAGVFVGDLVYAPGPGMLVIGTVVRIDDNKLTSSVTLRIMPALNLFSVSWVVLRDTGTVIQ